MFELDKIYCGDNCDLLGQLPRDYIDLVVTSPPYDDLRTYGGHSWDFFGVAWQLKRVLKPGGVIVWVVADATKDGSETGSSMEQALHFKRLGLNLHDTMIWEKTGMLPTQDRYYAVWEYVFVFSKGKPKAMNFIEDKPNTAGGRVQKKDAVINKGNQTDGVGTFIRKDVGRRTNVWRVPIGINHTNHPAIFPHQLAKDHIETWSNPGDLVLDPFSGSGTTAKAANELGRRFLGFEINHDYCAIAEKRLSQQVLEFGDV
jgi:site-specific DNA-methyltransferase (adenine-specific)